MLLIGYFSKICGLSVKTLRYYDEINLIKPSYINQENGYRFYEVSQLSKINLINRLKRYGFSLQEIKEITKKENFQIYDAMMKQKKDLEMSIIKKEQDLFELRKHLECYERTGNIMGFENEYSLNVISVESMAILSERKMMGIHEFDQAYQDLFAKVGIQTATICGAAMAIYHDEKEFNPECSDIEVAIPVLEHEKATRILDGGQCIHTIHYGSYATLNEAYAACAKYIEKNGFEIAGAPYEIYRESEMSKKSMKEWETDVYFPIKK